MSYVLYAPGAVHGIFQSTRDAGRTEARPASFLVQRGRPHLNPSCHDSCEGHVVPHLSEKEGFDWAKYAEMKSTDWDHAGLKRREKIELGETCLAATSGGVNGYSSERDYQFNSHWNLCIEFQDMQPRSLKGDKVIRATWSFRSPKRRERNRGYKEYQELRWIILEPCRGGGRATAVLSA